jgi:hypothetical protein
MATVTAAQAKFSTKAKGRIHTEIDSSVTISNAEVCGFNTDGEVIEFNATAAMIFYGIANGIEKEGDGTSDYEADIETGGGQIDHTKWTLASTSYANYQVPMFHTGATTAPTFTRPTTYAQVAGYQDSELEFVQFSESERAAIGICGGGKQSYMIGAADAADLSTNGLFVAKSFGRKNITKIGAVMNLAMDTAAREITLTVYKGTAASSAYSVGTIALAGTAAGSSTTAGNELVYTTAFTANDGDRIWIVPTSIGTAATAGSMTFFYEAEGRGGN